MNRKNSYVSLTPETAGVSSLSVAMRGFYQQKSGFSAEYDPRAGDLVRTGLI
ncbi:hypothetical protein [Undibacterium parvum]|uniref:hypothetical protein n=1 Tax=Undibacterium parvum TaxID=401471 RepID=UPI001300A777|nr:hypothetical protein [Undibacterium parvum]